MIDVIDMMKQKESSTEKVLRLFMVSDDLVHQSIVFLICSSNLVCALNR